MSSAGQLRERVAYEERAAIADDGYGNTEGDWQVKFYRSASIVPKLGGEQVQASRLSGVQPYLITMRSDSDTRTIIVEGRLRNARTDAIYNIRTVTNPDLKNHYLELLVEEGVADG